ncbi:MBL fold metallo-hydrolase [Gordonia sp. (in: high G+C Gram-positive bacteria)]|uniref:MBL fold metallo-hydrolase n=1 Tax=Gordonia sp. (in: high G+C Gram-positive bacteria) TaxID=84139 RepID=UPI0039E5DA4C
MTAERLSEHVEVLRGSDDGTFPRGNPLLVRGGDTVVRIDASLDHPATPNADLIVLSHYHEDHVVGLGETSAPVMVHERDLACVQSWEEFARVTGLESAPMGEELRQRFRWSERPDAVGFSDVAVIDVGGGVRIRVVPLPGHTAGHCGFLIEPDGVLYIADVDLMAFGPFYADIGSELSDVRGSLARCAEIDAGVYTTFHHKGPYDDRPEYLSVLGTHAAALDARDERILALVAGGAESARDMVGRGVIYRLEGRRPWYADAVEEIMIGQHMVELGVGSAATTRRPH